MAGETKNRILAEALALFAKNGYLGTSMSDLANRLHLTKGALYRHFSGKQEILDQILCRMQETDAERAEAYGMPLAEPEDAANVYLHTPVETIRAYSIAQFRHWTEEPFAADFRRMLTLEQYRDPKMMALYQAYLATGPLTYMAAVFRCAPDFAGDAMQLAMTFYGPMFLLYSAYDAAEGDAEAKKEVFARLEAHIERFIRQFSGQTTEHTQICVQRSTEQ